ncbi:MAG: hypothetical protein NC114_10595 [Ruminococcus flavefaciens]|nr:hypothetical protein [Ruminococcus flavefaciens]
MSVIYSYAGRYLSSPDMEEVFREIPTHNSPHHVVFSFPESASGTTYVLYFIFTDEIEIQLLSVPTLSGDLAAELACLMFSGVDGVWH